MQKRSWRRRRRRGGLKTVSCKRGGSPIMRFRFFIGFAAMAGVLLPVMQAQVRNTQRNPAAEWPMYNRDLGGTRFSPLNQITTRNVVRLTLAWTYKVGKVKAEGITGGTEFTPIVVNGM